MSSITPRRRTNILEGRNPYMNSSAAPVLPQEEYPRRKPKRPRPESDRRDKRFTRVGEKLNRYILSVIIGCVVVAGLSIGLLTVQAKKSAVRAEMRAAQALTDKVNASTERIDMMLNATVNMDEVRETATTRLGMQPAAPHQIVTINVAKDSYSVQYDDKVAETRSRTILEKIFKKEPGK